MVRANPQGEATLLPPISSLSPLLCSPIVLDLSTHPTTQSPPPPAQSFLVHLDFPRNGLRPESAWALDSSSGSSCRNRLMAGMWWGEEANESAEKTGGKPG